MQVSKVLIIEDLMRIKRIIYFIESPFCRRDFERFGIGIIKDNGFCVEIWDFTPFISPKTYNTIKVPDPIDYQKNNCRIFMEKTEVIQEIKNLKQDTMIILMMHFDYEHYFLYRELSKQNISYAFIITNAIPVFKNIKTVNHFFKKYWPTNFTSKIKKLNLEMIKKYFFYRVPGFLQMIKFPDFIFTGGSVSLINYKLPIGKKTNIVWGHTLDYDLYLRDLRKSSNIKFKDEKYIVFCDGYLPLHPEWIRDNEKPPITPEIYYPTMCNLFSKVEKETGLNVVIAAHPRSKYEELPDYFDGRKVLRGKTMELIRDSEFVLMHGSTSLNFVVLYHKPVLFLTIHKIEQSRAFRNCSRVFSSELNKGFIIIDSNYEIDWDKALKIDEEAYANYKEKYIKIRNSREEFFWQIVADEIKES
jgi:hypothetical protein